jgi:NTP pyrophosphatase (non-canonical NTP hydrolase)
MATVLLELIYPNFVASRAKKLGSPVHDLLHGAVGVSGEAGELLDAIKKCWIYNKPLTKEVETNLREECGDALFYIQHICNVLNCTIDQLIDENIRKLTKRYPNGYSDSAALDRLDKAS